MPRNYKPFEINDGLVKRLCQRVYELGELNSEQAQRRSRTRDLMDGGARGIARITGQDVEQRDADLFPAFNLFLMANTRMAQKIGKMPTPKADPPAHTNDEDALKKADKRARIDASYDHLCKMRLQLPQSGRWLPGYGFFSWTIDQKRDINGDPYPHSTIRDPHDTYPGVWSIDQQPDDVAYRHVIPARKLADMYPEYAEAILGTDKGWMEEGSPAADYLPRAMGGVILPTGNVGWSTGLPTWANQSGDGVEVWEYRDSHGSWWLVPAKKLLLSYVPNPLTSGPAFVVVKRFSFNQLVGAYDQAVGMIAAIARLIALSITAAEDAVNTETNIEGDTVTGEYIRGRRAVNKLRPGSRVIKMNDRVPGEVFNQLDRLERMLRAQTSYPVSDDGVSPMDFLTGLGLEELKGSVDNEVKEYQLVMGDGLELVSKKRFEWAEKVTPNRTMKMEGVLAGSGFTEDYTPSSDIDGNYNIRKVYGIMAGFDEPNKIIGGSNLLAQRIIDRDTFREQIDGLEDPQKVKDRVLQEDMQEVLKEGLMAQAAQGNPAAVEVAINLLPDSDEKQAFLEFYLPMIEQQRAMQEQLEQAQAQQQPQGREPVPSTQTVLARMMGDQAQGGVQTVTQV